MLSLLLLLLCGPGLSQAISDKNKSPNGVSHQAHAVPGGPYIVEDIRGTGSALVKLDGGGSHSHYYNPATGKRGRIVRFTWTLSKRVICRKVACKIRLSHGTYSILLTVEDNESDVAYAHATVKVLDGALPGLRCLFYRGNGMLQVSKDTRPPIFSSTLRNVDFSRHSSFQRFAKSGKFSVRVVGELQMTNKDTYIFRLICNSGSCTLWLDGRSIVSGRGEVQSKPIQLKKQTYSVMITYRRLHVNEKKPVFTIHWRKSIFSVFKTIPSNLLRYRPGSIKPVIHFIRPSRVSKGDTIKVYGSSFVNVQSVRIGGNRCTGLKVRNQFSLSCAVPIGIGMQQLVIQTEAGRSNKLSVELEPRKESVVNPGLGYVRAVRFKNLYLKKGGKIWKQAALTSVTVGPDGKYYFGSASGKVHVVDADLAYRVQSHCSSETLGPNRSILGLAFNPAENQKFRLYATASVMFWGRFKLLPYKIGWRNGEVVALEKKGGCIEKTSTVISGLPVSNFDHAVNSLTFDNSGRLLVTVGSSTNAGVHEPGKLGGVPDSPLSGSIIMAAISDRGFNGHVSYVPDGNPEKARKVGGSVSVFATGLRNSFGIAMHSNGFIYATDNGANEGFGARSTGCSSQAAQQNELDSLNRIIQGGYYGSANRNRGRNDPKQCRYHGPTDSSKDFVKPIATFQSSTNGLIEYTANTFAGQMRGKLIATKFASAVGTGRIYCVELASDGSAKSVTRLAERSGLSVALTRSGGLAMPQFKRNRVAIFDPVESNPGVLAVTSVLPFRGPKRGGGTIIITGWNLLPPITVTVGGRACKNPREFRKDRRGFKCTVPGGTGKATVIVRRGNNYSKSHGFEYIYMDV